MRLHNKLRLLHLESRRKTSQRDAETKFRFNPHLYATKVFTKSDVKGNPTFPKETAEEYFTSTYEDKQREHVYEPLPNLFRPPPPQCNFPTDPPSFKELLMVTRKKRNASKPAFNGLSYLVYKKCPSVLRVLHRIFSRIWSSGSIPQTFGLAFMILLPKSDLLNQPDAFRNIALTNTHGKLFFSVLSYRLTNYMTTNHYIDTTVQKGFLPKVSGCIEHTYLLNEALKDAKRSRRQIIVTWVDLANAYGSVPHNLIQFALSWYHIPLHIRKLIFQYYEILKAMVSCPSWKTKFFNSIGLFQAAFYPLFYLTLYSTCVLIS